MDLLESLEKARTMPDDVYQLVKKFYTQMELVKEAREKMRGPLRGLEGIGATFVVAYLLYVTLHYVFDFAFLKTPSNLLNIIGITIPFLALFLINFLFGWRRHRPLYIQRRDDFEIMYLTVSTQAQHQHKAAIEALGYIFDLSPELRKFIVKKWVDEV